MDDTTRSQFSRIAEQMGWTQRGDLDKIETELLKSIGKGKRSALLGCDYLEDSEMDQVRKWKPSDSERVCSSAKSKADFPDSDVFKGFHQLKIDLHSSDDEEFEQFVFTKTEQKASRNKPHHKCQSEKEEDLRITVITSESDENFEDFLQQVKTPKNTPAPLMECNSAKSLKDFIVNSSSDEDFIITKKNFASGKKGLRSTPASQLRSKEKPESFSSPVFLSSSDSEDDGSIIKSTWRSRHSKIKSNSRTSSFKDSLNFKTSTSPTKKLPLGDVNSGLVKGKALSSNEVTKGWKDLVQKENKCESASVHYEKKFFHATDSSGNSDEEMASLMERIRQKNRGFSCSSTVAKSPSKDEIVKDKIRKPEGYPKTKKQNKISTPISAPPSTEFSSSETPIHLTVRKFGTSQSEKKPSRDRGVKCSVPGCFLQDLSDSSFDYTKNFKKKREELTKSLFVLYNSSIFQNKLPENMEVTWNKKMTKTSGYCVTGQRKGTDGQRYARIELSDKVCDSAERLRDTLVHEMCHAATWFINGVRDGHGTLWKLYAKKSTLVHPELPMVTRCHTYEINYKYHYQCTRCKHMIGRHSKSLDTQRFVCAFCQGTLILMNPSNKKQSANEGKLTPFAAFVKENYKSAKNELSGMQHGDIMRKLSADFALKARVSES
ncbi:acidic repeat-containing protein isoform X2 [Polypterus senegalus]|nr:acidic repeat-containing protein isoform X2 [Polypterus senegalus]XP_039621775.1 acidic repeat-containing protein isoform X2 [Polypterus senegalus]